MIEAELLVRDDVYTRDVASAVSFVRGDVDDAARHSAIVLARGTPDPRLWAHAALVHRALCDRGAVDACARADALTASALKHDVLVPWLAARLR